MDEIEREELLKRYEDAVRKAQEEYENAVGPIRRKYESIDRKAHKVYEEAIAQAQMLIKDIEWDSEDHKYTLKSY
jgi:DNA invertase Pin-like site-specific DNA recombinase